MEKWKKRSIELLAALAFGGENGISVIPYYPQKTRVGAREDRYFKRSAPERHGVSSLRIYNMLCELEGEKRANVHSLMVLKNGEVICECSAKGYSVNMWHASHSMSKTVCGMIIGILIGRGELSLCSAIVDVFPEISYRDRKFPSITVEHLLTMTTGVDFGEMGAVTEENWTRAFFDSTVRFTPGSKFAYNSMNSYILARTAERVSGKSFSALAEELIFAPMGIKSYFWEKSPEGTEKGGWGLYLSPESWAKLGHMFASGGVFEGDRILPAKWVLEASDGKAEAPEWSGRFNYSYHTWVSKKGGEVLFNGMFGQNLWISKESGIMVVVMGGNNELFQESPALEIIRKYMGGRINDEIKASDVALLEDKARRFFDSRRWVSPKEREDGILYRLGIKSRTRFDEKWTPVLGSYHFRQNDSGILPLVIRVMQNNLNSSLHALQLDREGEKLILTLEDGGRYYSVEVGIYEYKTTILEFMGESYIVKTLGEVVHGEGEIEYRIELLFPETSSVRRLRIVKNCNEYIQLELTELPDGEIADGLLSGMGDLNKAAAFGIELLERRLGQGAVAENIRAAFKPELIGANTAVRGYGQIIESENNRLVAQKRNARLVKAVVDRFFKENAEDTVKEGAQQRMKNLKDFFREISKSLSSKSDENN